MTAALKVNNILNTTGGPVQYRGLPSGTVCGVSVIKWDRPIALSGTQSAGAKYTIFGGEFTKKYNHTSLAVELVAFGQGPHSGNCGTAIVLDYLHPTKECWDYGTSYTYDNQWQPSQIMSLQGYAYFVNYQLTGKQIEAGLHTMHFGLWVKRTDQGSPQKPFSNLSPNGSTVSDARAGQTISRLIIREIGL